MIITFNTKLGTLIEYDDVKDTIQITPKTIARTHVFDRKELTEIIDSVRKSHRKESTHE